jgi:hypothetical protein
MRYLKKQGRKLLERDEMTKRKRKRRERERERERGREREGEGEGRSTWGEGICRVVCHPLGTAPIAHDISSK